MLRIKFAILCLAGSIGCYAQQSAVKEADHILSSAKPDFAAALKAVKPALEHEDTKTSAEAWYYAGKASLGLWDRMLLDISLGQEVKNERKKECGHYLIDSYEYFRKSLMFDSLPNEKGKIKPKYSKDILNLEAKNYRAFRNAGIFLYDVKDLQGAYDAWEIYVSLPSTLKRQKKNVKADSQTELGQIYYYQALCAMSTNHMRNAIDKFVEARMTGFSNKDLYLYGMEASRREKADSMMLDFARLGCELYGDQEVSFALVLINDCLKRQDYESCQALADKALTVDSDDKVKGQLYDVLGVIRDSKGDFEGALANFQKAVVYDPNSAKAYFDLARVIYNASLKVAESGGEEGEANAAPGLEKAAEYFEKAYSLNPSMSQIPETLYGIYYRLGVGYEAKATEWEKRQK